jgi:hypothetical protein
MYRGGARIIAAALLFCAFALGCGSDTQARVRVINASPDSPRLDVLADNALIGSGLHFRDVSGYEHVGTGSHVVSVFDRVTGEVLLEGIPFFAERKDYTIVVVDFLQVLDADLLTDDNSPPAMNEFKLRFLHSSPTANTVDVFITAPGASLTSVDPTFSGLQFRDFAGYATLPQGQFQIRVAETGTTNVVADSGPLMFVAGEVRTALLVNPPGTATEPLALLVVRDAP